MFVFLGKPSTIMYISTKSSNGQSKFRNTYETPVPMWTYTVPTREACSGKCFRQVLFASTRRKPNVGRHLDVLDLRPSQHLAGFDECRCELFGNYCVCSYYRSIVLGQIRRT